MRTILVGLLLVGSIGAAPRAEPKSAIAAAARDKRDAAAAKAEEEYRRAIIAADKADLQELQRALDVAFKEKNLDEAE